MPTWSRGAPGSVLDAACVVLSRGLVVILPQMLGVILPQVSECLDLHVIACYEYGSYGLTTACTVRWGWG